jgi:hypothetical protein
MCVACYAPTPPDRFVKTTRKALAATPVFSEKSVPSFLPSPTQCPLLQRNTSQR